MTLTVDIVSVLATLTGFLMLLGPAPDAKRMLQTRTTGATPLVPLAAMFACGWIWSIYGLLHNDIFPLTVTNAMGVVLATGYLSIFYRFTTDRPYAHKVLTGFGLVVVVVTVYAVLGYYGYTHQSRATVTNVLGYAGNVAVFIFFAAPFENIALVVRHRTGLFIPITIVAATFLNAVVWLVYSLLTRDWLIFVPNVGALVIGGVQIGVYAYFYPGSHPLATGTIPTTATAMAMGSPSDLEAARPSAVAGKVYAAVTSPHDGK